jgi:N-acetylglucosamine transport system permease protein
MNLQTLSIKNSGVKRFKDIRQNISNFAIRVILLLYTAIVIFPVLWSIMTSFKTSKEFYEDPWKLPKVLQWQNYVKAWSECNVSTYFLNSVFVSAISLVLTLILAATSAYVLARFKFKFCNLITTIYVSGLLVPAALTIVPTFLLLNDIHLLDSLTGIIAVFVSRSLPFSVFVLLGFFKTIPHEIEESAYIDGSSLSMTFWRIVMPMSLPGVTTINIFNFLYVWNDYLFPLVLTTTDTKRTLSVGVALLSETAQFETDWGTLFAGITIIMIPTIIVYMIFESKITEGITAGALKG